MTLTTAEIKDWQWINVMVRKFASKAIMTCTPNLVGAVDYTSSLMVVIEDVILSFGLFGTLDFIALCGYRSITPQINNIAIFCAAYGIDREEG